MKLTIRRILVTGASGFIGKNLLIRLNEHQNIIVKTFLRGDHADLLPKLVAQVDAIVHLAGENRPIDDIAFEQVNFGLTSMLCNAIEREFTSAGRHVPIVFTSSTQVKRDNLYGRSKLAAEAALLALAHKTNNPCVIFRLPGVFGKWCKPNYNSVIATFCYNIARELPIQINDPSANLRQVYVDDVVSGIITALEAPTPGFMQAEIKPEYIITLGELANQIRFFSNSRASLIVERVGMGFTRALYATYLSYLPIEKFSYKLQQHLDKRGVFVEMLKTHDSGQFSYFTAHPGITRGGHYHHTKTEKFLVIKGEALFQFRQLLNKELVQLRVSGNDPQVVDSIPGWTHNITNVGNDELVVMLWANENFDREKPDTVAGKV